MEGKTQGTASMICGIGSLVALILCYLIEGNGAILFMLLLGLAAGIVAICLAVAAKKMGYMEAMQKAGFILGIIGTSLTGIVLMISLSSLF